MFKWLKNREGTASPSVSNVTSFTSACSSQSEKGNECQPTEQLQKELNQEREERIKIQILYAQLQKDMENVQKKYKQLEEKNIQLEEEKKILLVTLQDKEAQLAQLRRMSFGQSTEQIGTAGHKHSNTTGLQEGTASSTDKDTEEAKMAAGTTDEKTPNTSDASENNPKGENSSDAESNSKGKKPRIGNHDPRPNGIRNQMAEKLPTIYHYPLLPELIRKLDEKYGKNQWNVREWEATVHMLHIPEMYANVIDHVPVLRLKDGTLVRPFTEYPDEFSSSVLPHSILTSSEFANIVHKKIGMGIPLYRQEQDMLRMIGVHLGRQDMAQWMTTAGTQGFQPVYKYLKRQELACEFHAIDETFLQTLRDGRAAATKSYLWVHSTGNLANPEHPIVVFCFEKTRSTEHLRKYFPEDIVANISCDHYIAYEVFESERENVKIFLCWMHVRRRFFAAFDLVASVRDLSDEDIRNTLERKLLEKIGEIYKEEMKLKKLSSEERKTQRDLKVRPLVDEFFSMLRKIDLEDPRYSRTLRDAVQYALGGEEKLKRFLDDPNIPIDNGHVERLIRGVAAGRRSWLFCDTPKGAEALAVLYSLVVTAQLNHANDYFYIKYLCERVPGKINGSFRQLSDEELEALMPWSPEYRAYEEHEIKTRYDAITFNSTMKEPTNADIREMRRQMEEEEAKAKAEAEAKKQEGTDDSDIGSNDSQISDMTMENSTAPDANTAVSTDLDIDSRVAVKDTEQQCIAEIPAGLTGTASITSILENELAQLSRPEQYETVDNQTNPLDSSYCQPGWAQECFNEEAKLNTG